MAGEAEEGLGWGWAAGWAAVVVAAGAGGEAGDVRERADLYLGSPALFVDGGKRLGQGRNDHVKGAGPWVDCEFGGFGAGTPGAHARPLWIRYLA
ncbi:hypothetical protein GCM10018772_61940 [Streptomyces fumanus]|uniref:Uncharacterized protein n=1 Tax=Streptomyces fumanus TaxID=67302 RepID=A0A919AW18_9ACTN|nr:hypothetical protein GCM10018772_61940 [Streptomyces fumanus]